jgi:hypothetical protein
MRFEIFKAVKVRMFIFYPENGGSRFLRNVVAEELYCVTEDCRYSSV